MSEQRILLEELYRILQELEPEIVGELEMHENRVTALGGRISFAADVLQDEEGHSSLAHCHIVAELPMVAASENGYAEKLDACVVGINEDRKEALLGAVANWAATACAPIFSLLLGREVMGATYFDGSDDFGIAGCCGYAGVMMCRAYETSFDLAPFQSQKLFDGADTMAPPATNHLAKVTLQASGDGRWIRNLEVDGHLAAYADELPESGDLASQGVIVQFATFHYNNQPEWIATRQTIDDAINRFVEFLAETQEPHQALASLEDSGVDFELTYILNSFTPLAFGRALFSHLGAKFSTNYILIRKSGEIEQDVPLLWEPVYVRSLVICHQLMLTPLAEAAKTLALFSPEVNSLSQAVNQGQRPDAVKMMPPIVVESGTTAETRQTAMETLQTHFQP
jgi:hypothetical protein